MGSPQPRSQLALQEKVCLTWRLHSWSQQTQKSGFIHIHWASSSFCTAERWSTCLGLPNGAHLYIAAVLLPRDCRWTRAGRASWTSWSSWRIWVSSILWAERTAQAWGSTLLPHTSQAHRLQSPWV